MCDTDQENHPGIQHLDLSWALSESVTGAAAEASMNKVLTLSLLIGK